MLIKRMFVLVIALLTCGAGASFADGTAELLVRVAKPGARVSVDQVITDGKVLVSVEDARNKALFGLTAKDFSVTQSGRKARILSVKPISESLDVPRHIVLVLDNSYSMEERKSVKALLAGVDELLKTVRPMDQVSMVVFDAKLTTSAGGRVLHVQTFQSNQPTELKEFAKKAYSLAGLTATTVLYEGMLAGLDLIGKMPATEPRFMVVFTDGDDLNSAFKREDVLKAATALGKFNAYAIDYKESPKTDKFLTTFATQNRGQIWKAQSEKNLVPIFQSVASKMQYFYVVNYEFLTTGNLTVTPSVLTFNEVRTSSQETRIDASALTLRPVVDSANGITRWKVAVSNAKGSVAELAGEGAPAAELKVPLPTADLQALAAGGDLAVKMELQDGKGQNLALTAPPVTVKVVQTSASLAVVPASLTIEEIKTIDVSPMLGHIYFAKGSSEISAQYVRFAGPGETAAFDEQKYRDTREKYYQLLNIVGKRLTAHSAATLTLVGCNDNTGVEKGKKALSGKRAEAVRNYLQTVWNIAPERMVIEVRNLPAMPSSIRLKEGQAENRRVEIHSTEPLILDPIRSTYLATRIDTTALMLRPDVVSPHGIAGWEITVTNAAGILAHLSGNGSPVKETKLLLGSGDLRALAAGGDIAVKMELQDRTGQRVVFASAPVKVNFIETSQRLAKKEGLRVQEKYALILFDFNKEAIGVPNQEIINRIVARIKTLPEATVEIVGHTDTIGTEAYNIKLSERRASAAYKLLAAAYGGASIDRIHHSGVGPDSPLYDNLSPETRAFNRTVTITLEYMSAE
jgi:outer membrane protein OmpA-like peptidoglycan-associated protein/Mg-chelatase subunit ChlD